MHFGQYILNIRVYGKYFSTMTVSHMTNNLSKISLEILSTCQSSFFHLINTFRKFKYDLKGYNNYINFYKDSVMTTRLGGSGAAESVEAKLSWCDQCCQSLSCILHLYIPVSLPASPYGLLPLASKEIFW